MQNQKRYFQYHKHIPLNKKTPCQYWRFYFLTNKKYKYTRYRFRWKLVCRLIKKYRPFVAKQHYIKPASFLQNFVT